MSSQQDLIKLNEVIAQCNQLLKDQSDGWKSIVEEIKKVNSNAPSSYIKMQQEIADNLKRLENLEQKYNKTKESANKIQTKINTDVQKTLTTGSALAKQRDKEIAQTEKLNNVYNKVQQKVNALTQTYNNIATKKELGLKLTAKEEAQLNSLTSRLEKYNGILKKVDATIGKNQRNVGNYASHWDGLGNSINQLTREAPAFAVSMSTGFLALSNNIPILADEIGNLIKKNKELQAQGKPTKSVFGSILGAVLSWQTALSVGVTLLTLYGDEVVEWVSNLGKANYSVRALETSTKAYNEALKGGDYQKAYTDVTRVGVAFEQARKGTLSKTEALKVYNETLGVALGETNDFNVAQDNYAKKSKNYIEATLMMSVANNILSETAKISAIRVENASEKMITFGEKVKAYFTNWNDNILSTGSSSLFNVIKQMFKSADATQIGIKAIENRSKAIEKSKKEEEANLKIVEGILEQYNKAAKGINMGGKTSNKSNKDKKEKEEKDLSWDIREQEINNQIAITKNFEEQMLLRYQLAHEWYQEQLNLAKGNAKQIELATKQYTGKLIDLNNQEYEHAVKTEDEKAKFLLNVRKTLEKVSKELDKQRADANKKRDKEEMERLQRMDDFLKNGMSDALNNMGMGSLSFMFNSQLDEMWKTTDKTMDKMAMAFQVFGQIANDVFAKLNEQSNIYFNNQYERLEKEKEVALTFAGESESGKRAIEEQYEEKKKQIEIEQAKRQKRIAIFQSEINTAMGVVSAIARADIFPYNFVLAGIIGAMGLAQTAMIASTPLPEFWTGTDNAPEGFALTQERGAEIITDKNGNIKTLGSDKGTQLTYLNKGDKVLTATETQQKLNEMLMSGSSGNNINIETSNGLTAEEMESIMNNTLAKQPKNSLNIDERGFNVYQEKQNQRKLIRNKNARI